MEKGKLKSDGMLLVVNERIKYLIYKIKILIYKINCIHERGFGNYEPCYKGPLVKATGM